MKKFLLISLTSILLFFFIFVIYAVTSEENCGTDEDCAERLIEEKNN